MSPFTQTAFAALNRKGRREGGGESWSRASKRSNSTDGFFEGDGIKLGLRAEHVANAKVVITADLDFVGIQDRHAFQFAFEDFRNVVDEISHHFRSPQR